MLYLSVISRWLSWNVYTLDQAVHGSKALAHNHYSIAYRLRILPEGHSMPFNALISPSLVGNPNLDFSPVLTLQIRPLFAYEVLRAGCQWSS